MASRSYRQYCGLAAALDVVGERWALLVVRDLEPGPRRFTDLFTGLPGVATDVLAERLRSLEAAGAVRQTQLRYPTPAKVYELTERGRELAAIAGQLARWGAPLLPPAPAEAMRMNPRWALQSMVLAHTGQVEHGQYAFTIDGDEYTVTIDDTGAHLSYGPPDMPALLHAHCDAAGFFAMAVADSADGITLEAGSLRSLRSLFRSLPLRVGPDAATTTPPTPRRTRRPRATAAGD